MKRVFLIVLDSFGIGETEDAASCGDVNEAGIKYGDFSGGYGTV